VILRVTFRDGTTVLVWCPWATNSDDVDLALAEHTGTLRTGPEYGPRAGWIMLDDVRSLVAVGHSTTEPTDLS